DLTVWPVRCANSEFVVLTFEQDPTSLRLPISDREPEGSVMTWNLFEQLPQILKHFVFFVRARAISEKELLAQVQCFPFHCRRIKPVLYRSQEFISVHLAFSGVPRVTNRSHSELIERRFRLPIELRDRVRDQPVLREHDQIVSVHAIA